MKNLFLKIFESESTENTSPEKIKESLLIHFPNAINVEWKKKRTNYEAVFYLESVEYIALFSETGELLETKQNLWLKELPLNIITASEKLGEVMNGILIKRQKEKLFEIIVRNQQLDRTLLLFNEAGILINKILM